MVFARTRQGLGDEGRGALWAGTLRGSDRGSEPAGSGAAFWDRSADSSQDAGVLGSARARSRRIAVHLDVAIQAVMDREGEDPQVMGGAGRRDWRGAAHPVCAIRRPGVSSPGAERGGTRYVLCFVWAAGAHCAERLGLACDPRGDGSLQSEGWARPTDRRVRRRRAAMALRPVFPRLRLGHPLMRVSLAAPEASSSSAVQLRP